MPAPESEHTIRGVCLQCIHTSRSKVFDVPQRKGKCVITDIVYELIKFRSRYGTAMEWSGSCGTEVCAAQVNVIPTIRFSLSYSGCN